MQDWTGNAKSVFTTMGAAGHALEERETHDYYATEPRAVELLLEKEKFSPFIWECACGEGHMSEVLKKHGYDVRSSDLIDRGYPGTETIDFLTACENDRDIITNPPYKYAKEFVEKALAISPKGTKIAMFLKLTFLEGKARKKMFECSPPKVVYVSSSRLQCAKNGDFDKYANTAVAYAWYIWQKGYDGNTIIKWIN